MKKVLIVLACIALVLPLFALSAFAVDVVSVPYSRIGNTELTYIVNSSEYYISTSSGSVNYPIQTSLSLSAKNYGTSVYRSIEYFDSHDNPVTLSEDSSSPTLLSLDSVGRFRLGNQSFSSGVVKTYYVVFDYPVDPLSPVGDGVTTFIGYGGQVLSFLTNNSTLLFLIGLSVGLCLVIPFGVQKIKDLLKGY